MTLVNNSNVHESAQAEEGSVRARKNRTLLIDARGGGLEAESFDSRVERLTQHAITSHSVDVRDPLSTEERP